MKKIQVDKDKMLEYLKNIHIFQYLNDLERFDAISMCELVEFEGKERIIAEGEVTPNLFAIIKGVVSVMVRESTGKEVYITAIGEGDVFGEAAIFLNVHRTADIYALDKLLAVQIERQKLMAYIKEHPRAGIKILMLIVYSLLKKLRESNQELAYERKTDYNQEEVDAMIKDLFENDVY